MHSRQVVHRPHGKTEPVANKYRPQGVAQYGQMQGSHITRDGESNYRGEAKRGGKGYEPPGMISDPVKAVGVGGGRTIYKTGRKINTVTSLAAHVRRDAALMNDLAKLERSKQHA